MLGISNLCRYSQLARIGPTKLLGYNSGVSRLVSRQLITPMRNNNYKNTIYKGFKFQNILKSNPIILRFCSSSQPKQSKLVGYWLLGCSGMVFAAVVLGMALGYIVLLYSVYYVINLVLNSTNGSK